MGERKIDLSGCRLTQAVHFNGGREWFGYLYRCVEYPRLQRMDRYESASQSVKSTWRVDGEDVADLDAAKAALALPPVLTDEHRTALALVTDEPTDLRRSGLMDALRGLTDRGLIQWERGRTSLTPAGRAALRDGGGDA